MKGNGMIWIGLVVGIVAGAVTAGPQPSRWTQMWRETSPRRLTLWAILLAGVAFLGFMAWRLLRAAPAEP